MQVASHTRYIYIYVNAKYLATHIVTLREVEEGRFLFLFGGGLGLRLMCVACCEQKLGVHVVLKAE